MKRNGGYIRGDRTPLSRTSVLGFYDLFDVYNYQKSDLWPLVIRYVSCTESTSTVAEGASMSFAIVTEGLDDGTTLYYTFNTVSGTAMSDADLTGGGTVQGSFTLTNNAATLNFSFFAEVGGLTEGNVFKLEIRTGSVSGTVVMESGNVTVTDVVGTAVDIYIDFYESRYGSNIGTIYHYIVDTSGNILHTFGNTSGNSGSTNWISVSYSGNTYSITPGTVFRFAIYHDRGSSFRADYAIDAISYYKAGSLVTTYGFEGGSGGYSSGEDGYGWIHTGSTNTTSSTTALASSSQIAVSSATGSGMFNADSGGTSSGGTGPTGAYAGTYYAYTEATSYFNGNAWLFSPEITA
tara:strand:- start:3717 stop:4766 length:1050 start_codon:yes stop_codon:yes gene_type:complete